MDKQNNENSKSKKIIIILVILLILSLLGLLARYLYLNNFQKDNTVTVPNNVINEIENVADKGMDNNDNEDTNDKSSKIEESNTGKNVDKDTDKKPSDNIINDNNSNDSDNKDESGLDKNEIEAPKIELDKQNPSDNERFDVSNMLPGDSVTKYFCVKTTHDFDVKVYFESTVLEQIKKLGDVLDIKVFDVTAGIDKEKIVTQGTFNEINKKSYPIQLKKNKNGNTVQYYKIVVSLDTSVGNPYQAAKLSANFKWYVTDEEVKALSKDKPIIPGITKPNNGDTNKGEATKTGDIFDKSLWAIFIGSALMIILLSLKNRSRREDE